MIKIHSRIDPEKLLHVVSRLQESDKRLDLLPEENPLQVSICKGYDIGYNFKGAHKHLPQERNTHTTSESWLVIKGALNITLFDIDNSKMGEIIIYPGDCYVYLGGGHSLTVLDKDTIFYEYKNGPYNGQASDKEFF